MRRSLVLLVLFVPVAYFIGSGGHTTTMQRLIYAGGFAVVMTAVGIPFGYYSDRMRYRKYLQSLGRDDES